MPRGLAHIDPWDTLSELVVRVNGLNPGMVSEQQSAMAAEKSANYCDYIYMSPCEVSVASMILPKYPKPHIQERGKTLSRASDMRNVIEM